jgi:outer membrane lipoprotein-sorting protein
MIRFLKMVVTMKTFLLSCMLLSTTAWSKSFVPASFSANFEESYKSVASGKDKKSFGKIDYKYPGHIRFQKTDPDPSLFVSNPEKSWYYVPPFVDGEEGQVTIQKSSKLPLTKFLDSIKNGVNESKLFKPKYQGKELVLSFVKPVQKDVSLKEVILLANKDAKSVKDLSEFEKMTLVYNDGRKVNLKFIDLKENIQFPEGHFKFTVPAKTKVTND